MARNDTNGPSRAACAADASGVVTTMESNGKGEAEDAMVSVDVDMVGWVGLAWLGHESFVVCVCDGMRGHEWVILKTF